MAAAVSTSPDRARGEAVGPSGNPPAFRAIRLVSPLCLALLAWTLLGTVHVFRTFDASFTHDYDGHVEYTRILTYQHRLPRPYEAWQTYHPPLYYLIDTLLAPGSPHHPRIVRLLSVGYGAAALALLGYALAWVGCGGVQLLLILLFTATTPAFLFMFSSYNNDALSVPLSMGVLVLAWRLAHRWSRRDAILYVLAVTAGLYTKYTLFFTVAVVIALALAGALRGRVRPVPCRRLVMLTLGAGLLFLPWMIGHNYRLTHKFLPHNAENGINAELRLPHGALRTVLMPPGFSDGEWDDPFTHLWEPARHKKTSYLAYLFSSSIFGEYTLVSSPAAIPWAIVYVHLAVGVAALRRAFATPETRAAALATLLGALALTAFVFRVPYAPTMDYRYIAWIWLPLSILYAAPYARSAPRPPRVDPSPRSPVAVPTDWVLGLFVLGVLAHACLLLTIL